MKRIPVSSIPDLPDSLQDFVRSASLYDSSCSGTARVWFADTEQVYIKTAAAGTLQEEAQMNAFFHSRGIGPQVLAYLTGQRDWMVTRAIPGEDCIHPVYLNDPGRLSELLGLLLRRLHETDIQSCPLPCRAAPWGDITTGANGSGTGVLIHGDYCLPNIMLDNWNFSGFLDVGAGGIGDRHMDLYWGCWSLQHNLKDNRWCSRFLDAYGRDLVDPEKLHLISVLESRK